MSTKISGFKIPFNKFLCYANWPKILLWLIYFSKCHSRQRWQEFSSKQRTCVAYTFFHIQKKDFELVPCNYKLLFLVSFHSYIMLLWSLKRTEKMITHVLYHMIITSSGMARNDMSYHPAGDDMGMIKMTAAKLSPSLSTWSSISFTFSLEV